MTAQLESRAEIAKLARLLDSDPGTLAYLQKVAPQDLRRLREQTTDVLFDADRGALQRMAAASRLIPVPVLAKIAEVVFGPLLCARIAGLLDPPRAVDIAARLNPSFLADVAVLLDPRRASQVIAGIPADQIAAVADVLLERGELVTMGRFIGHLSDAALRASVELADEAALLRIAFVLEGKERLDDVLGLLPRERLAAMIEVAAREDLWPEVLDLLGNIGAPDERARLSGGAAQASALVTLAAVAATLDVELLERAASAACEHRLWRPLIELAGLMDEIGQRRVAEVILSAPDPIAASLFAAVASEQLWAELLVIASRLEAVQLERLALRNAAQIDLAALIAVAEGDERFWEPSLRLLAGFGGEAQGRLAAQSSVLSPEQRARIAEHALQLGLAGQLEPFARVSG